jgi:hypothetical protein
MPAPPLSLSLSFLVAILIELTLVSNIRCKNQNVVVVVGGNRCSRMMISKEQRQLICATERPSALFTTIHIFLLPQFYGFFGPSFVTDSPIRSTLCQAAASESQTLSVSAAASVAAVHSRSKARRRRSSSSSNTTCTKCESKASRSLPACPGCPIGPGTQPRTSLWLLACSSSSSLFPTVVPGRGKKEVSC